MSVNDYDVILIGGGPSSALTAALVLQAEPARRVLILEREAFPRPHVGETALPNWSPVLRRAGILDRLIQTVPIRKVGITFSWGPAEAGETWTADFREPTGRAPVAAWHVERGWFDEVLLSHARELGADVRIGATVTAVRAQGHPGHAPPPDGVDVPSMTVQWTDGAGATHSATAGHVVDASGQSRVLANLWGLPLHRQPEMNNYAVHGYWTGSEIYRAEGWPLAPEERWAVIGTCDLGWIWHIPIGPDLVSVGLVTHRDTLRRHAERDLRDVYRDAIGSWAMKRLLTNAELIGGLPDGSARHRISVVSDWAYVTDRICGPGWFITGDAAIFVDPILSSGLILASQGALMVANALLTVWNDPAVSAGQLRDSFTRRYRSLGDTYRRMARAWYRRNVRSQSWHWVAQQERLRAGGDAIYELAPEALTAISMGTVIDPLESAYAHTEPMVASTFRWVAARRLFERDTDEDPWRSVSETTVARTTARRALRLRWQALSRSKLRLRAGTARTVDGYHTHERTMRWEALRYVELRVPARADDHTELDEELLLAFPELGGRTASALASLDGTRRGDEIVRAQLGRGGVGSTDRTQASVALFEMLTQLDMLGQLEASEPTTPEAFDTTHAFCSILLDAFLRSADGPLEIAAELDWLGEQCIVTIGAGRGREIYQLADASLADRTRFSHFARTTALIRHDGLDDRARAFVERVVRRLDASAAGEELWVACRTIPATRVLARYDGVGEAAYEVA